MGIDLTGLRALSFASRVYNFNFCNSATLGRHEIHFWKQEFEAVRKDFNFDYDETLTVGAFCEPLLQKLGAKKITSVDASAFEGASCIHDFNCPVPDSLHNQFDAFLDFGSMEHIFDVAQVIENIVKMVKTGGSILLATNANGFPAHGLFQYSPEFFYSVFCERNGFRDTSVFLVNTFRPKLWHLIKRPVVLQRRNQIPFEERMMVLVFSTKIGWVDQLSVIQSDYDKTWTKFATGRWAMWKSQDISRWKKILHQVANPYAYRIASEMLESFRVRRGYKSDRVLIDPDRVDPTKFLTEISALMDSGIGHRPIEAHL
ncbi:class I SAM-dependent methyltransferase [Bradyrhizobium canariense]|uniref:class I SAM-dependent methyltransferase n=1 Tax=Bradyrhizobium canariense TaxID=255045 RepID=UPI001CA5D023|nr:class I SAM-dependent methyltransferase [Bradyrhizobium canariense]MBW5438024.1 class I SAM-dependent methyltransferase [Bradyrhizobium canariense]